MQFATDIEKAIKLSQQIASQFQQQSSQQEESSKIVDSFDENFKEKGKTTKGSKPEEFSKIKGWKYDADCRAIIIKRDHGRCNYYYHTYDLLKLSKAELRQLANLRMINPAMYPQGYEFEEFLKKQAKKDFEDYEIK